jgi:DNA (cytosine-5)-methyltransferase 1
MAKVFQVVDLFAGPGGLAEGFSSFADRDEHRPFDVTISIEKEASAHQTLRLRSFLRQFDGDYPAEYYDFLNHGGPQPDWSLLCPEEWKSACEEALRLELGTPAADRIVKKRIAALRASGCSTVVIGGPPCQAYSLAGRVRNQGKVDYVPENDHRHFLYQEYINILEQLQPAAFVMENVKGMLSSSIDGGRIFERVLADLRNAGPAADSYRLFAIGLSANGAMTLQPAGANIDYVVRAERFGVPQARHRLIIVGVRHDLAGAVGKGKEVEGARPVDVTVRHMLEGMPRLRSGLTKDDGDDQWRETALRQMERVCDALAGDDTIAKTVLPVARAAADAFKAESRGLRRESRAASTFAPDCPGDLAAFLSDPLLSATLNHAARGHMADDLGRYFFASVFGLAVGRTPKSDEFPVSLAPAHANWETGKFADRFRVQRWDSHSTTVTSHISKDGHYFVHPDPSQCRSLTVREAARLQTFPDNYLFLGNRTEQYVQVGNAVPPYLAKQIAGVVFGALTYGR